jgi:hypothetical protein
MDDWSFSPWLSAVYGIAASLIAKHASHLPLGRNGLTRFLNQNLELAIRFSNWLERERAFADNPATLKDYFAKVLVPFVQPIANLILINLIIALSCY